MSKHIHQAPLALGSDGSVLLNVVMFDVRKNLASLVEQAVKERGAIFIGITIGRRELEQLEKATDDAFLQAGFALAGGRQNRLRNNKKY